MDGFTSWEELEMSAYQAFRITETEHIEKAYNKKDHIDPLLNADSNGITGSGETDGQH